MSADRKKSKTSPHIRGEICFLCKASQAYKERPLRDAFCVQVWQTGLRYVFVTFDIALDLAVFFVLDFFLAQFVGSVADVVFHLADRLAGLAFCLLGQTFSLGLFVAGPLANLALCAASDVLCLS